MWLPALVLVLAAFGLVLAFIFTGLRSRWIAPDASWLPSVCRLDEAACSRVVDTPQAALLGVPNSVLGLGYYLGVAAWTSWAWSKGHWDGCELVFAASLLALALSVALAWILVRRLRVACVLCFAAHAVNLALAVALGYLCLA